MSYQDSSSTISTNYDSDDHLYCKPIEIKVEVDADMKAEFIFINDTDKTINLIASASEDNIDSLMKIDYQDDFPLHSTYTCTDFAHIEEVIKMENERDYFITDCQLLDLQDDPTILESQALNLKEETLDLNTVVINENVQCVQPRHKRKTCESYKCRKCGLSFMNQGILDIHISTCKSRKVVSNNFVKPPKYKAAKKAYKCSECDYRYSDRANFELHLRVHKTPLQLAQLEQNKIATMTNLKPYKCSMCIYSYSNEKHLKVHMQTHAAPQPNTIKEGSKKFTCQTCRCKFAHEKELVKHSKTHIASRFSYTQIMDFKPFKCDKCDYRYSNENHLNVHIKTHRPINNSDSRSLKFFNCVNCLSSFSTKNKLRNHLASSYKCHPSSVNQPYTTN